MRVIIAGYGIGGAALALGLQQFGIDCVVLEQAEKLEEVGAGVQLSPNGVSVLKNLGVMDELEKVAFEPRELLYRDWETGEILLNNPLMPQIDLHFGAPYYHAHRADLLRVLRDALGGDRVKLGKRIIAVEQRNERVFAYLEDGTCEEGDVLIGADGIHSLVRAKVFQADAPQSSGCLAWRGLVDAKAAAHLNIKPSAHVWMGPNHSAVIYYVSGGQKINWICIGSAPMNQKESWSATTTVGEVLDIYKGWNREVTDLIALTNKPFVTALYDRSPLSSWVKGRIALMGDAAHAMLPYHAQGAVQSLEDAWVLARLLDVERNQAVEQTLARYEQLRMERTARIQEQSRLAERRFHMSDPTDVAQRNDRMRKYDTQFKGKYLPQQEWLFGYDADLAARGQDDKWRALRTW
ncbi:MAG: FAD-dependent monooxygenase [Burkholderiaceae bacterium]